MKTLVLAEKPSVGRELARVLSCTKKENGFFEGAGYIVTWAMGHLVELADPEVYDEKYGKWTLEALPMLPEKMKHKVIGKVSRQFNTIKRLMARKEVTGMVIATDAGREGELVARWIMRLGGWKGAFKRLWISSQTDTAIKAGFRSLKEGRAYDNLFRAAECRAEADWLIGLNVTRALSCKHDIRLSAGRVQTPTIFLIAEREREITSFIPKAFWTIRADFGEFYGVWVGNSGNSRINDQKKASDIAEKIRGKEGRIVEIIKTEKRKEPPAAYDLTSLQGDANRILGFSAKKTLQTLQSLYERHKIVTYPRTDSRYITKDIVPTIPERLHALSGTPFGQKAGDLSKKGITVGKRFVDDTKVRDHHALLPTEERVVLDRLTADERGVWELVVKRFLEVLSSDFLYEQITLKSEVTGELFLSRGTKVLSQGWKGMVGGSLRYIETESDEQEDLQDQRLAGQKEGSPIAAASAVIKQGFTTPPPRYTEGTLLAAMENAGKFIKDTDLKKSIQQGGLGTPATRADIIEKIISNYYIERKGKELLPTSRGISLLELVPELLKRPNLTAVWEQRLTKIAEGAEKPDLFLKDIRKETELLVKSIKESTAVFRIKTNDKDKCPLCGKPLLPVRGKKGNLLVCQGLSCGYEEMQRNSPAESMRPSHKEKSIARSMMRKYGDNGKETSSFGDLLKASMERKDKTGHHGST